MKRQRWIASVVLCLMLAGAALAVADPGRGRGHREGERSTKSVEKSRKDKKEQSRKQRTVRRSDDRDERGSDGRATEIRREPVRTYQRPTTGRPTLRDRVVSRTRTPSGWYNRALRGEAQYAAWDGHRARHWRSEHRTWRARGGYDGYWVPQHHYRVVFGPSHRFRVHHCPLVVVSGYPRFYYEGYWVTFIDPWPEYWADDWFARDDCYIVHHSDGYYLTNARYPSVRIAVSLDLG